MSARPAEGIARADGTSAVAFLLSMQGTHTRRTAGHTHVALQNGQGRLRKRKDDELQGHVCVTSRAGRSHRTARGSSQDGVTGTGRAGVRGMKSWRG